MINISALLDEIKASPYREIVIRTPHTGVVTFADIKEGDEIEAYEMVEVEPE